MIQYNAVEHAPMSNEIGVSTNQRIGIIDGFRALSIISVLLYHFTNPWVTKYPHQDFFLHIFKYGYLGVNFFFMISGFVICYTLEHTTNLYSFYRNRFVRLFPAMFLCTLLIFIIIHFLDDKRQFEDAHQLKNILPGLTFTNPQLWTLITGTNYRWINGSFWSIWVEIQFYVIASGLYFANRKRFYRNFFLVGVIIFIFKYIPIELLNRYSGLLSNGTNHALEVWRRDDEIFNITFFIPWFLCGAAFYRLYRGLKKNDMSFSILYLIISLLCLTKDTYNFYTGKFIEMMVACSIMVLLFLFMIYYDRYLAILKNAFLCRIGVISYSIYLIHEQIGVLLINKYEKYLGSFSGLTPFLVIGMIICFGELSYRFYEKNASKLLKCIL